MEGKKNVGGSAGAGSLDSVAREQIVVGLRQAMDLATGDLSEWVEPFREILSELTDRADVLALTRSLDAAQESRPLASRLSCVALSAASGEPVTEWLLIPFGEVVVERPVAGGNFVFTRKHAESAKAWFERMGRKLAIDYEHQSFDRLNTRPDGLRPAAGWIGGLEVRDDGLWAVDVTWTERARELLRSGEYRYFSPVIYWTDEEHVDVAALGPVGLTNDPAMRGVRPLAAARKEAGAGPAEERSSVAAGADSDQFPDGGEEFVPRAELESAQAEIAMLRKRLAGQEADTFVERGMRLGKILDSTSMDWRGDYLRDPELAEERLSRAPVLLPPGRVVRLDRRGEPEAAYGAGQVARRSEGGPQQAIEPEDLVAFRRAAAAGRVRGIPGVL